MIDDLQLIKECLEGKQSSYQAIYERYKGYCYTICIRYGVKSLEVKDVMQIIFMQIFKSLKKYDPQKSQFKTWLTRITINQILMQKRKLRIVHDVLEDERLDTKSTDYNLSIEQKIDKEILYSILSKMPKKYIEVFNLFVIDGYTHPEIAKMLNITKNTSRVLLHRGRHWAMERVSAYFEKKSSQFKKTI